MPVVAPIRTAVTVYRDKHGMPSRAEVDGVPITDIRSVEQISEARELPMVRLTIYATVDYVDEDEEGSRDG